MLRSPESGLARRLAAICLCALLGSCGGGTSNRANSGQQPDPVVVDLPIAYIKRPLPVDANNQPVYPELSDPAAFNPGAALYLKARATALTTPVNITDAAFAAGALYDVKDLSVSADGSKLLFAMHAPLLKNVTPDKQTKWHIWEYNLQSKSLRPIITSAIVLEQGDDVSPRYLPDGRIAFSSTRQLRSKAILLDEGKPQFAAQEEGGNSPAFNLHSMKDDGSDIQQISYNQSHDLQPTLLQSGKLLFTRWDHAGADQLSLYSINPDGSELQRYYGYFSMNTGIANPENRLFRPQELPDGRIAAILQPDAASLGGDMVAVDIQHFYEDDLALPGSGATGNAQVSISALPINIKVGVNEFSVHGRYAALSPMFDGSNRLLVSWSECRLLEPVGQTLKPCTPAWLATAGVKEAPPLYGIWVYNPKLQTQQPVVLAEEGVMFSEPVSLDPRAPASYLGSSLDGELASESVGLLHIRSVYDVDGSFNNFGSGFGSLAQLAQAAPEQRPARFVRLLKAVSVPDMITANALGDNTYGKLFRSFRGLREILGYAPVEPDGSVRIKVPADLAFSLEILDKNGQRIGPEHNNWLQLRPGEVRECNGCHNPVSINAGHGRAAAELPSINPGAASSVQFPATLRFDQLATPATPAPGETMAEFASHSTFCLLPGDATSCAPFSAKARGTNLRAPSVDLVFDDEWTDPALRAKSPGFAYRYNNLAPALSDVHAPTSESCREPSGWSSLCRITINYEQHIQPIWERSRPQLNAAQQLVGDSACIGCHSSSGADGSARVPAGQLELLRSKAAADKPMLSYTELTAATDKQILDENATLTTQIPVCELAPQDLYPDIPQCVVTLDANGKATCAGVANCPFEQDAVSGALLLDALGNPVPLRQTIALNPSMSRGSARASARFFNRFSQFAAGTDTVDHRGWLNNSELKLLAEWLDIGGGYYNNPFDTIAP